MSGKENYPWQDFGFLDTRHFHFLKWPFLHPHFSNYFSPFSLLRKKKILSFCTHFHSFRSLFSYSYTYKIFSSFSFSVFLNLSKKHDIHLQILSSFSFSSARIYFPSPDTLLNSVLINQNAMRSRVKFPHSMSQAYPAQEFVTFFTTQ